MTQNAHTFVLQWPQSLPGRIIAGVLALTGLVLAFFFLFFVVIAGSIAIAALYLRTLWRRRHAQAAARQDVIEGEYSVERPSLEQLDDKSAAPHRPD